MPIFEALMLICFGCSWPVANLKTWRAKRVEGQSVAFKWLVFLGYLFGIGSALTRAEGWDNRVLALYLFNLSMVGLGLFLYYRYRPSAASAPSTSGR